MEIDFREQRIRVIKQRSALRQDPAYMAQRRTQVLGIISLTVIVAVASAAAAAIWN